MLNATSVLRHLRQTYPTYGRAQRQKLLYYIQAWSLAWTGKPVFTDQIEAWRLGPVVRTAWALEKNKEAMTGLAPSMRIDEDTKKIIESVFNFYGGMTGKQLIDRTHEEAPWKDAFYGTSHVSSAVDRPVIPISEMRRYYSQIAASSDDVPAAPSLDAHFVSPEVLQRAMTRELARWAGVNRILASQ